IDCGGPCAPCATGSECTEPGQCPSHVCSSNHCAAARCDDGVQNGSESDVDCGPGCVPCALGKTCNDASDCATGACSGTCSPTLRLELWCANRDAMPACIQPYVRIVNGGSETVSLSDFTWRYYYTKAAPSAENYGCYYVNDGDCNQVAPAHFGDLKASS